MSASTSKASPCQFWHFLAFLSMSYLPTYWPKRIWEIGKYKYYYSRSFIYKIGSVLDYVLKLVLGFLFCEARWKLEKKLYTWLEFPFIILQRTSYSKIKESTLLELKTWWNLSWMVCTFEKVEYDETWNTRNIWAKTQQTCL